jgi:hypothetical protein
MNTTPLPDVDLATLTAWAEAGEISTFRYAEEVNRRRREQALAAQAVAVMAIDPGGCAPPVYVDLGEDMPEAKGDLFHHPIE